MIGLIDGKPVSAREAKARGFRIAWCAHCSEPLTSDRLMRQGQPVWAHYADHIDDACREKRGVYTVTQLLAKNVWMYVSSADDLPDPLPRLTRADWTAVAERTGAHIRLGRRGSVLIARHPGGEETSIEEHLRSWAIECLNPMDDSDEAGSTIAKSKASFNLYLRDRGIKPTGVKNLANNVIRKLGYRTTRRDGHTRWRGLRVDWPERFTPENATPTPFPIEAEGMEVVGEGSDFDVVMTLKSLHGVGLISSETAREAVPQ